MLLNCSDIAVADLFLLLITFARQANEALLRRTTGILRGNVSEHQQKLVNFQRDSDARHLVKILVFETLYLARCFSHFCL